METVIKSLQNKLFMIEELTVELYQTLKELVS